jgi:uncharacterized protein
MRLICSTLLFMASITINAAEATPAPASSETAKPSLAQKILEGAKRQAAERTAYSPGYVRIAYPNGDVPRERGVCTDVIIRSLRHAGLDLQKLIHEDMKTHFARYPQNWGLSKPDSNIDHRRVPNQIFYFSRQGTKLTTEVSAKTLDQWRPGDLVYWKLENGLDHCGVVSGTRNAAGIPLVIHNISQCCEEDLLQYAKWKITAHYRVK